MARKVVEEKQEARREEIIDACEKLYKTMSFKAITMKEISLETSFTRPSVYNYFHTKEEIFLALLQREYARWGEDLKGSRDVDLSVAGFAGLLAGTLAKRECLLKLLSMNHFEMEENSRLERLTDFKVTFGMIINCLKSKIDRYFPAMSAGERDAFLYAFLPFMFGIYPYTHVTEKQLAAMSAADTPFILHSTYEMIYNFIIKTLRG